MERYIGLDPHGTSRIDLTFLHAEVMNGQDVRVRQRRDRLGLALETRHHRRIGRELRGQHLDRHLAIQPLVSRPVDLTHPAGAQEADDDSRVSALFRPIP